MGMTSKVREGETEKRCVTAARRAVDAVARSVAAMAGRPALAGIVLTVAALAMLSAESLPSGAVTVAMAHRLTVTTPAVSPVTITVPATTVTVPPISPLPVTPPPVRTPAVPTPAVTAPRVTTPPVTTSPVTSTPSVSTPGQTSTGSTVPAPVTTSPAGSGSPATQARRSSGHSAAGAATPALRHLREVVVRLSQCVSTLSPSSQRLLLLRAGIATARPESPSAVARTLGISVAREARLEHAALVKLATATRTGTCGAPPAWIHVPADHRLVRVDTVFVSASD
jgi:hypothetical protein